MRVGNREGGEEGREVGRGNGERSRWVAACGAKRDRIRSGR